MKTDRLHFAKVLVGAFVVAALTMALTGCTAASLLASRNSGSSSGLSASSNSSSSIPKTTSSYDPLWPTDDPELLAIPIEERWYSAQEKVGTVCTLTGPVVNVYWDYNDDDEFVYAEVEVGDYWPSEEGFSLIVWADDYDDYAEMLDDVDGLEDCWLQVTGELFSYGGRPEFDSWDSGIEEYYWWTPV